MSEEKREVVFADGFIFKKPKEGAPDFVKGDISIKVGEFIDFLNKHNNNGWVNLNLKKSTAGKLYVDLNNWTPKTVDNAQPPVNTAPVNAAEDTRVAPAQEADIEMPPF
tara:strand:- start:50 stop:376 length:327 start_codon:yes stop_codon:yes gene_type:complete